MLQTKIYHFNNCIYEKSAVKLTADKKQKYLHTLLDKLRLTDAGGKKLFQESENSSKPEYIHGHMYGCLGILAGSHLNWACIPLSIRLHDDL